jgi:hypothetical protein
MRCESTHFGVKFYQAPLRGGRRYTPCTPAQDRAAVAKIWVRTPILGRFGAFLAEKAHVSTRSTLAVVQDSICAVVSSPRTIHTDERKNIRQEIAGFWRAAYFLMKLALDPLNPAKFPLRKPRRSPPPPALRRTLTVTIIPVTSASGAAAPGVGDRAQGGACGSW